MDTNIEIQQLKNRIEQLEKLVAQLQLGRSHTQCPCMKPIGPSPQEPLFPNVPTIVNPGPAYIQPNTYPNPPWKITSGTPLPEQPKTWIDENLCKGMGRPKTEPGSINNE